jgi:hypothetical protein
MVNAKVGRSPEHLPNLLQESCRAADGRIAARYVISQAMTRLSVNLNKVALLRNSRQTGGWILKGSYKSL